MTTDNNEEQQTPNPVKLFMFRLWIDGKESDLITFFHSHAWNREVLIFQIARLYPEAKNFKLYDGHLEIVWDNTPEDCAEIVDKLNNPQKHDIKDEHTDKSE